VDVEAMRSFLVAALLAAASCGDPTAPAVQDLALTTAASRTSFRPGDAVMVTVTVTNVGTTPQKINGRLCGAHPFAVARSNSEIVGPERRAILCNAILEIVTLAPGESYAFADRWYGGSNAGTLESPAMLAPGEYFLRGSLPGVNARASVPITIDVLPPQ
jgi:hypothetical protein